MKEANTHGKVIKSEKKEGRKERSKEGKKKGSIIYTSSFQYLSLSVFWLIPSVLLLDIYHSSSQF